MKKTSLALLTVLAMVVACFTAVPAMAKSKSGPALVKSATHYYYDFTAKKWKKSDQSKYAYKKGYPSKVTFINYESQEKTETKYKFKFKKNKPVSAGVYNEIGKKSGKRTYKKGRVTKIESWSYDKTSRSTSTLTYGKKSFVKRYNIINKYKTSEGKTEKWNSDYRYTVKLKKGLPKNITGVNKAYSGDKYYSNYNKKGLLVSKYYQYGEDKKLSISVKYKYKKGNAATVTRYYKDENGKMVPIVKYVLKYTKTKINKQRYASMINSITDVPSYSYATFSWF